VGDAESGPVRLSFNPQLRVEFRGATVTSDAGLLLPRELDERLSARWADLDGPLLQSGDRDHALKYEGGTVRPPSAELWG